MTWYDRYYKEKVIYEDIFSVPIIQMLINLQSKFFWGKVEMHRLLWWAKLGVG